MRNLKQILPRKTLRSLYYTIIHLFLLYCITIWGLLMKRLKSLQNNAVKVIAGAQYLDDSAAYYKQLNILKIEDLDALEVAKLMHKFSRNKLPKRFSSVFTPMNALHT